MELATNAKITVSSENREGETFFSRDRLVDGNAVATHWKDFHKYCYHSKVGCVLDSSN